jgi:hypothetical protein
MKNIYEDIHPEIPTEEFEDLLVELREVIDEEYCFKNGIDYNLAIFASPTEILHLAIDFIKKTQEKEKE